MLQSKQLPFWIVYGDWQTAQEVLEEQLRQYEMLHEIHWVES